MWYSRRYESTTTSTLARYKNGYVQDLKGSDRYRGSSPVYSSVMYQSRGQQPSGSGIYSADLYGQMSAPPDRLRQSLYNRAYARMREKVQDGSTLGTTIAEGRESLELIAQRGASILKAVRRLKRGDPRGFAYELSVPQHHRRNGKFSTKHWLSGHWLEYWLGVAPTIADVEKSIKVLGRDHNRATRVKTAAFESYSTKSGALTTHIWPPYIRAKGKAMEGIYVQVRVDNPNTYLAAQLGLLNPVAIAWELVPLSFVANWFYDVGSFLNSMDTFYGLKIEDGGVFSKYEYNGSEIADTWNSTGTAFERQTANFNGYSFRRGAGTSFQLPRPVLELPHLSWSRAATSISLLTQFFLH